MSDHSAKKQLPKTDLLFMPSPDNFAITIKASLKDICPLAIGKAGLPPGKQTQAHSLHSVHLFFSCQGGGKFQLGETWYHVREHDFFILPLGALTLLYADVVTGWTYRYISFTGELANDFMDFPTVFSLPEAFTATLYDPTEEERNLASRVAGDLFHIHAKMQTQKEEIPDYVQTIINRINTSYMEKLTVTEMAKELGVDRSHLSRLFKSRMDITIQDYLLHFRIVKAKQYLLKGYSVTDTATLCGFGDRINLSRAFLKETGVRPTTWLKYMRQQGPNRPR